MSVRALLHRGASRFDIAVFSFAGEACDIAVAGLHIHQRTGGEIMSERMSGDGLAFPAAIDVAFRFEAGIEAEIVQKAVGLKPMKVIQVRLNGLKKG